MACFLGVTSSFIWTLVTANLWFGLYLWMRKKYDVEREFIARFIAGLHAVLVVLLAVITVGLFGPNPLVDPGEENTCMQEFTMTFSVGYFVYDLLWCIIYQPNPKIMLLHHATSIVSIFLVMVHGKSGAEAVGGIGSLELTNPLLQARWFLRTFGYLNTPLYNVVEISFLFLFLTVRLGYGTALLYSIVTSSKTNYTVKVCTCALYLISLAFIYIMLNFIIKKYIKGDKPKEPVSAAQPEEERKDR